MEIGLVLAGLVLLGFACQWLAWRLRLPAILFLLLAGIALGPLGEIVEPDELLGDLLFPAVQLGVAIILFEGSLTLRFSEIRGLAPAILLLVTVGAAVTVLGLALAAILLAGLPWSLALLFGALNCVTGPTVIVPLLRAVRPRARIAQLLRWEGIIIDPLGALLALLVFQAIIVGAEGQTVGLALFTVGTGVAFGFGVALLLAQTLTRRWVPDYLDNFLVLAAVLAAFAISNTIAKESGLLAVTIMGMTLANYRGLDVEHILEFKENLSTVLISILFLVLAARLNWPGPETLIAGGAILLCAMLLVRPVSVFLSTIGSPLTWRERAMVAYVSPRGIVAAAISALFALELAAHGFEQAPVLVHLTYIIILGTVILQSGTARFVARWLDVAEPTQRGVLIVGSSPFARQLAGALHKQEVPVLLADDDWHGIRQARMAGIPTYFGNPVSEHAAEKLPLTTTKWLLALSTRIETNSLACVRYQPEFGKHNVLRVRLFASGDAPRQAHSGLLRTRALFGKDITQSVLERRLAEGWTLRTTRLGDNFNWTKLRARFQEPPLPLFAIDERGNLHFATESGSFEPKNGWKVTVLGGAEIPNADAPAANGAGNSRRAANGSPAKQ